MTAPEHPGSSETPNDKAGSSVRTKLLQRKIQRYLVLGFLAIVLLPIILFLTFSFGGPISFVLTMIVGGLFSIIFSLLIPLAFVSVIAYAVYSHYRKPAAVANNAVAGSTERLRSLPMSGYAAPTEASTVTHSATVDLSADVAALDVLRNALRRESVQRQIIFVPLSLAVAFALGWTAIYGGSSGKQSGSPALALVVVLVIGGFIGWVYATSGPAARYAAAFKERLLPRLLSRYGQFTHAIGAVPQVGRLVEVGLLPQHDVATADDEIRGIYRDRPVRICELALIRQGKKRNRTPFQGLLIEMAASPPFTSTTVITDNDALNNQTVSDASLQRVRLEDPRFDQVYRVFGTDQISARAVLTPAVMERLLILADGQAFSPPYFFCEGERMVFALHRWDGKNLIEPPSLSSHDAGLQLAALAAELADIFGLIDAMIEMQDALKPQPAGPVSAARTQQ